jgi:hypothetical protein
MNMRMKGRAALLLAGAALLSLGAGEPAAPARQAHEGHQHASPAARTETKAAEADWKQGAVETIVGQVICPACYLEAGAKSVSPAHFQCAVDCARSGQTMAFYDRKNDRIYFIAGELPGQNPNDPVMPYINKMVDVRGNVYYRAGAWGIVILTVKPHQEATAPSASKAPGTGRDAGR